MGDAYNKISDLESTSDESSSESFLSSDSTDISTDFDDPLDTTFNEELFKSKSNKRSKQSATHNKKSKQSTKSFNIDERNEQNLSKNEEANDDNSQIDKLLDNNQPSTSKQQLIYESVEDEIITVEQNSSHPNVEVSNGKEAEVKELTKPQVEELLKAEDARISIKNLKDQQSKKYPKFKRIFFNNIKTRFVVCDCKGVVTYDTKSGTKGITGHKCKELVESIEPYVFVQAKQSSKESIKEGLLAFCCKDMRPFISVEGDGFKFLIQKAIDVGAKNGRVKAEDVLISGVAVSSNVEVRYNTIKQKLISILNSVENVCFVLDHFTHKYSPNTHSLLLVLIT